MSKFSNLMEKQKELKLWETISSISFWDQLSVMPPAASNYRAEQNALIAKTKHEKSTSSDYEKALLDAYDEVTALDDNHPNKIQVSRLKESFDKNKKISSELVERLAKASAKGSAAWEKAKENRDTKILG